ncbi:MAG: enoyl-CoA hydratase/isomerase family protein [Pseudomonadota bacterium]|nr:enoyl-CoA hydratase/isomerase family protein [Pseudomonadota bacterium]
MTKLIESIDHGPIRELRLARAPVNALNPALSSELATAVADASAPGSGILGLVLSGGPKVFSAGLDVPYLVSLGDDRAALRAAWDAFFQAARALAGAPLPVVAALAGHAPAGGCVLALCCDYRVMANGPYAIGLNETQVGLVAPEGIQHLLRRVVGTYRAERLLIAGELVQADAALAMGLVDELVDIDSVATRARVWLEQLLALPRQPMLETRRIARMDLVAALEPERIGLDRFIEGWYSPDTQGALRALMAKLGK